MKERRELTQKQLKKLLRYNPLTGLFTNRITRNSRAIKGSVAGYTTRKGYVVIGIEGLSFMAHILAWLYMTGVWPKEEVDHKDRDSVNNAWKNLREATPSQNNSNRNTPSNNTSGYAGVCWCSSNGKWRSEIGGRSFYKLLGYFENFEEAVRERKTAEKEFGYYPQD